MAKRKAQLVCQHLERIPRKVLQDYPEIVRDMARGRNGIYALYRRDRLHYLGLARDLRRRLKQHLHDQQAQTWDRFSLYLTVGDD
ncbi:MAG: GIY-YIG nuclease family protein, partial [Thermoleophilia bacterium]|nr:GIY-YIG nuclease family protein [Thermoleophilia bacterium]